jgi:hypothetical protein
MTSGVSTEPGQLHTTNQSPPGENRRASACSGLIRSAADRELLQPLTL